MTDLISDDTVEIPPVVEAQTTPAAPTTDVVSCPSCGTAATVTLNRRDSRDFCRVCDYPLFWTPGAIVRDAAPGTGESLRRLPGQAGRITVASQPCPTCAEPNALSALICIRCSGPMKIEVVAPPEPVYVAPAPVLEPVIIEEKKVPWWVWALIGAGFMITVTLIVLVVTGVLG